MPRGASFTATVGAGTSANVNGGDTTALISDGRLVTAQGGRSQANGSTGGTGINGDINRTGGRGGNSAFDYGNGFGAGENGQNGGTGGGGSGGTGGGGGCAGFKDLGDYPAGNGMFYVGTTAQAQPGGGHGSGTSNASADGGFIAICTRP